MGQRTAEFHGAGGKEPALVCQIGIQRSHRAGKPDSRQASRWGTGGLGAPELLLEQKTAHLQIGRQFGEGFHGDSRGLESHAALP